MARFKVTDSDKYGNNSANYFSLKNDKDVARVRFMYRKVEDVEGVAVHKVNIDGRDRYVNCLRSYDEPLSKCPLCESGSFQLARFYIPMYDTDEKTVKIWERTKKFGARISSLCARYPDLVSHIFEVERNGKAGDKNTQYEIYEVSQDDTKLEDLPEIPNVIGTMVIDASADDMNYYLDTGEFPPMGGSSSDDEVSTPPRSRAYDNEPRNSRGREEYRDTRESEPERRTPSRGRRDRF